MKKNILRKILLTAGLVALLGSEVTFGNSDPNINDSSIGAPGVDLNSLVGAKSGVGLDGKIRILWDIYSGAAVPVLNQSQMWILNTNGSISSQFILPAGSGPVPAGVGGGSPILKSNILFLGQKDGNTTLLFLFSSGNGVPVNDIFGANPVNGFSVVTINAAGQAIAGVTYGPFAGTNLVNVRFNASGNIIALWASRTNDNSSTYTAWALNEFGATIGANGPFGFLNTFARVDLLQDGRQVWLWDSHAFSAAFPFPNNFPQNFTNTLGIWVINNNGSFASAQQFGPF